MAVACWSVVCWWFGCLKVKIMRLRWCEITTRLFVVVSLLIDTNRCKEGVKRLILVVSLLIDTNSCKEVPKDPSLIAGLLHFCLWIGTAGEHEECQQPQWCR